MKTYMFCQDCIEIIDLSSSIFMKNLIYQSLSSNKTPQNQLFLPYNQPPQKYYSAKDQCELFHKSTKTLVRLKDALKF